MINVIQLAHREKEPDYKIMKAGTIRNILKKLIKEKSMGKESQSKHSYKKASDLIKSFFGFRKEEM